MAQRNKLRREFIVKDTSGNIVEVADDLAVDVTLAGPVVRSGGVCSGSGGTLQIAVWHPARVDSNHYVKVLTPAGVASASMRVTARTLDGGGIWRLDLENNNAGDITVATYDRLVIDALQGSRDGRPTLYKDDMSLGNVFSGSDYLASGEVALGLEGVLELYTDEWDVDLRLMQKTPPFTHYGYITDSGVGGRRPEINVREFGAMTESSSSGVDSWPGIQSAILMAEDDQTDRSLIRIPAGIYYITGTIVVSEPNVEIIMDAGTKIRRHASWSGAADDPLLLIEGDEFRLKGGYWETGTGATSVGIRMNGASWCNIDTLIQGGGTGLIMNASNRNRLTLNMVSQNNYGIQLIKSNYNEFIAPNFYGCGDVQGDAAVLFTYDGSDFSLRNKFIGGHWENCKTDILIEGDAAGADRIDGVYLIGCDFMNTSYESIEAEYARNITVDDACRFHNCSTVGGLGAIAILNGVDGFKYHGHISNGLKGIYVSGNSVNVDNVIIGGYVQAATTYCVRVQNCDLADVKGGSFHGTTYGLYFDDTVLAGSVTDNTGSGASAGIYVETTGGGGYLVEVAHNREV